MFRDSNYDIKEIPIAPNGMNQFISPDALPENFCYLIENIIPSPLGVGEVRYGTDLYYTVGANSLEIMKSFPFEFYNQSILYASYYLQDLTQDTAIAVSSSNITFNSQVEYKYFSDIKVKIVYDFNGSANEVFSEIKSATINVHAINIVLKDGFLPDPTSGILTIIEIWVQRGCIYSQNFETDALALLKEDLSVACVPRCSYFQDFMLICNGVDPVMSWNGTVLEDVYEFLSEVAATTFTRIDDTHFSFVVSDQFDASKYFVGNSLEFRINGILFQNFSIIAYNKPANIVTITTNNVLPAFVANQTVLLYKDKPPHFSYIYVSKDRLWAIAPGAVGLAYREKEDQLKIYYSYRPNSITGYGLFDENTKEVPHINMSDKYPIQDNFEAICEVNGMIAFMGRKHTQVWIGDTPGTGGNFSWCSNLPVGIFHGDLLIELSNDVYFVSQSGINSFSTLNIGNQFSATSYNAVDNIVKKFRSEAESSNSNYRKCTSFKYNNGEIAGFKISKNKLLSSLFSTSMYSWFYLSGDFKRANCFMELQGQLYMSIDNKIFKYADGSGGTERKYGDQDGASLIPVTWIPGLIKFKGKSGYANKRYELAMTYSSSFILNDKNTIEISIFGDIPRSFSLSDKCEFQYRGDLLGDEPLTILEDNDPTKPGFRLRKEYEIVNKRLKFSSSSFWVSISGYVMNGPVTFRRIRLFGIGERNA